MRPHRLQEIAGELRGLPSRPALLREPGERLLVKAPFEVPDGGGEEWMWVEVTAWKGDVIHGLLMNRPHRIPDLEPGAKVTVKEGDVFDYMHEHEDGTLEGNETGELIRKRTEKK